MDRRRVLDLCTTDNPLQLAWLNEQLDIVPILPDQAPQAYILARAKACFDLEPDSVIEPSSPQASEPDPSPFPNVMSASEAEAVRAPSPASDERDDMDILASEQGDATHTVATQNEEDVDDDVPLLRRSKSAEQQDDLIDSTTTSRTNSSSPPPPAPPAESTIAQPTTISPSLLLASAPSASSSSTHKAPVARVQTLATSAQSSKSKSPSPSPVDDSARSSSSSAPAALNPAEYRQYLSETLMSRSSQSAANKLIAILAPASGSRPFVSAPQRVEILSAMKSGSKPYFHAWLTNQAGMDLLGSWIKILLNKDSEQWKSTAVVLLEVVSKVEFTKDFLTDATKMGNTAKYIGKLAKSEAMTTKARGLAAALVESMRSVLSSSDTNGKSSTVSSDEASNKKRKTEPTPSSSKPTSASSTPKPVSATSGAVKPAVPAAKPPVKQSLAKLIPAAKGPAAKTDSSWFSKTAAAAAPKKAAPPPTASKPASVFQQAIASTGGPSTTVPAKRPISAVEEPAKAETGEKRTKRITWRDEVQVGSSISDIREFKKTDWELAFEGSHDFSVAQLDQAEGSSMKSHAHDVEDDMIDWVEPAPLYLTEDETKEAFPPYTGTFADIQAALDAAELAVMYYARTDIPDSPAETDNIVTDGPSTLEYDQPKADQVAYEMPVPVAVVPAAALPMDINLDALLASFKPQDAAPVGYSPAHEYNPAAAPPPLANNYGAQPYQQAPPPPQPHYNGYSNGYVPPPPPQHQSYQQPPQHGQYGAPPAPGPPMYGGGQPPYDPYGPGSSNGYDRDGPYGGVKRERPDQNGNGYDRDGKRGRGDWDHGRGGGHLNGGGGGGGRGKIDQKCKYFPTRNGCSKGNNCPFRHSG